MDSLWPFFSATNLSPHGFCLLWRPDLLRLHVVSDAIIGLSYFSIPITLITVIRRRSDLAVGWVLWLFVIFIMACGTTHWMSIWTIWHADYGTEGLIKAITATASLITAVALWRGLPTLMAMPSLAQIRNMNRELQAEIRDRIQAETTLTGLNQELEQRVLARTMELTSLNQALQKSEERFRQVVESAPSAIVMVNSAGRIEMMNAQTEALFGYPRADLLGESIECLVPERYREHHPAARADFFVAPQSRPMGLSPDLYARRRDGTEFPVEIGLNPIDTDDGPMVLSAIVDISDRKNKEEHLNTALKEKDVLLSEIHHRVKNNLQIVHSLLDLQSSRVTDAVALEMLRESRNRINSMAIIHQVLYGSDNLRRVDFAAVLRTLVTHVAASYGLQTQQIQISINATPVFLPLNAAIPCGLIVNELVSNTLKHAFPDERVGNVFVTLQEPREGEVFLSVADTGIGLADSTDLETSPSLGLKLVHLLTKQIGGTITIAHRNPTCFTLTFPVQR